MIGHFPIFRKSRILFEPAASLGGSQQLLKTSLGDAQSHYPYRFAQQTPDDFS